MLSTAIAILIATAAPTTCASIPETLELSTIVIAMSEWGQAVGARNFALDSDYASRVREHFTPHLEHPLFEAVAQIDLDSFGDFVGLRDNSIWYAFHGDTLVHESEHEYWWNESSSPNHFGALLPQLEDFARASDFRAFYRDHESFYSGEVGRYEGMVDPTAIITWLETKFGPRYTSVDIHFSPLIRGNNTASWKGRELRVVVPGPHLADRDSDAGGDFWVLRQSFTELDHGYITPLSWHRREDIDEAMADPKLWNAKSGFYRSARTTFDEYMTWGFCVLYASETYDRVRAGHARRETVAYMRGVRGFVEFEAFLAELERLYADDPDINALYDGILTWIAQHNADR